MGDLISRSALIEEFNENNLLGLGIIKIIENQPTAFDKERIEEELQNELDNSELYLNGFTREQAQGECSGFRRALEIVEKGGVE